ncbi:MAG TPA: 4-alpha-glucanotransferase [Thermoanaerobaculia bacterium]|jgi:4-alpha-glucanotransferase
MRTSDLRELARSYGVQLSYEDAGGKRREPSRDALEAVLRKRLPEGLSLDEALERKRRGVAEEPPVLVAWDGKFDRGPEEVVLEEGAPWNGRGRLPLGYHHRGDTLIISAPRRAHELPRKTWGAFLPLYAAHTSARPEGDLGVLERYLQWIQSAGGGLVATLPLLAQFDDEPSPYSPVSRLFWNERYLDVEKLPEYRGERGPKAEILAACAERFQPDDGFASHAKEAGDYARFRGDERYHLYVQYRMKQQMQAMSDAARRAGPGLYLDFPLGVNGGGYDVQRYRESFAGGVSVGAPPDLFFTKGQNWGFPPFHPDGLRERRYDYFIAAVRNHAAHAGILRLDHVMGLHRLYWIPEGAEAKDGVYVRYPEEELYAILTLESRRNGCALVGEDLGTVPEYVPRMMEKHGLRRMYVVQYEIKPQQPPLAEPPRQSVASVNTHDMPTFAGFWREQDVDDRVEQELLDEDGANEERETRAKMRAALSRYVRAREEDEPHVLEGVLGALARSDAEVVLVNLEDLWGETRPQNVPGVPERSWRQKFRLSLEEAQRDARVQRVLAAVNEGRGGARASRNREAEHEQRRDDEARQ